MRKSIAFALLAVFIFSMFLRLFPLTRCLFWGADIGEYYHISSQLVADGSIPGTYGGWGFAYPSFPGMEIVVAVSSLLGMELSMSLSVAIPVLASLVVFPVFLITTETTGDARAGLIAAAFIAVVMPHVYATSHPMPASMGDLLFAACLLLFLKWLRNPKFGFLLFPVTLVLIVTHHLSTYFLLITLVFGVFLVQLLRNKTSKEVLTRELAYVLFTAVMAALFWFAWAPGFVEGVVSSESVFLSPLLFGLLIVALTAGVFIVYAKRKLLPNLVLRYPTYRRAVVTLTVVFLISLSILLVNALVVVPGTTINLTPDVAILFLPLVLFISFAGPGSRPISFNRGGVYPFAWTLAISVSTLAGLAISSEALLPYRHMEYLMLPVAVLAGLGVVHAFGLIHFTGNRRRAGLAAAVALGLVATNAAVAYPPRDLMGGWEESIKPEVVSLALWTGEHTVGLVAADHRVSTVLFGFGGVDATWDTVTLVFHAEDFEGAREELESVDSPSGRQRAVYVAFDSDTVAGVLLYPWDPAEPMSDEAVEKFEELPFQKMYEDGYSSLFLINWGLT
ncbi:MAG: hypothetical protein KAW84_01005 [Thermoplasmata archaeon]|nr:hypothetical protein [Thermoplasmata archaeon]